jgi:hypothetical protein
VDVEKNANTNPGITDPGRPNEHYTSERPRYGYSGQFDAVIPAEEESPSDSHSSVAITARAAVRFLPPVAAVMLQGLGQHRLLTARQAHALHMPSVSLRYTQRVLAELQQAGLAARALARHGTALWFPTPAGHAALHSAGHSSSKVHAANPGDVTWTLRAHIHAVNETGIAFVNAARARGDECDAFSWLHDVAHPLTPARQGRKQQWLIADALLNYTETQHEQPVLHQRFIAVDRATSHASQLVRRLATYKLLHQCSQSASQPVKATEFQWREHYRSFPGVLVVLADQDPAAAQRRIRSLVALWRSDPTTRGLEEIALYLTTLDLLIRHGPCAPIFTNASQPEHFQDWLGHATTVDGAAGPGAVPSSPSQPRRRCRLNPVGP